MCGIAGIVDLSEFPTLDIKTRIENSISALRHRGPDDQGVFLTDRIALGHVRLSILDLSLNGHQPMLDQTSGVVLTYNGEIYNFLDLKRELIRTGVQFKSHTDTEVVLQAYVKWGIHSFKQFDGMFAFSLYDPRIGKLFIVRDFVGIKPLYYYVDDHVFAFFSEIKGFKAAGINLSKISLKGFTEYLWYGNAISEETLFSGIKKLLPGRYLCFDLNHKSFEINPYWKVHDYINQYSELNEDEAVTLLREKLETSVQRQLMSDVPIGVCLSGGIDSSAITALASKYYPGKLNTFSVDFDFMNGESELPFARLVSEKFNTCHHELHIRVDDIIDLIESSLSWHDEPFADAANLPLFLISEKLKQRGVKVILQGDGGDELFSGYRHYVALKYRSFWKWIGLLIHHPWFWKWMPHTAQLDRVRRFLDAINHTNSAMMHALLLTVESTWKSPFYLLSRDLKERIKQINPFSSYLSAFEEFRFLDPVQRMLVMDYQILLQHDYLEKVDKPTMANGVEVRVPFLAKPIVEFALGLPARYKVKGFKKKYILKRALTGILPSQILSGKKKGFGVPYQEWLKKDLMPILQESISSLCRDDFLDRDYANALVLNHVSGKQDNGFILWKMMLFGLWARKNNLSF